MQMFGSKQRMPIGTILILFVLTQYASSLAWGQVALPGQPCVVEAHESWSKVESWVWNQVCVGDVADLGKRDGRSLDLASAEGWDDQRVLSPVFLESVLLHAPWAPAVPRQGVRIAGALFTAPINLTEGRIEFQLWLNNSRFTEPVYFRRIETRSIVSLSGSHFLDALDMASASIGSSIYMRNSEFAEVRLRGANIGDQLDMSTAKVSGTLNMNSVTTGSALFMF